MRTELPCISVFTSKAEDFREAADLGAAGGRVPGPARFPDSPGLRARWSRRPA